MPLAPDPKYERRNDMHIKYLGPSQGINVGVDGKVHAHIKGKTLEYPDEVGEDLLKDKKNRFEKVAVKEEPKKSKPKTNGKK